MGFDACKSFLLSDGSGLGKNTIIFGADMSSSELVDNIKKDILILGKSPTQVLDDTALTPDREYAINFSEQQQNFLLKFAL